MSDSLYNTDFYVMNYYNSRTYRLCILRAFNIHDSNDEFYNLSETERDCDSDSEEETDIFNDLYNNEAITRGFDYVFESTKNNPAFQDLYKTAAGKQLLSEEADLGMVLLFAYDYFPLFHKCLYVFFNNNGEFTNTTDEYVKLKNKLNNIQE